MYQRFIFLALLGSSSAASAHTFSFVTDRPELVPSEWFYREVSSRSLPGCWRWDVLQGSGWFPATWYTNYIPVFNGDSYNVETRQKLFAKYCGAKMDAYNSLSLEMEAPLLASDLLRGTMAIVPDGESAATTVECGFDPDAPADRTLKCEAAHVRVDADPVVITINFVGTPGL